MKRLYKQNGSLIYPKGHVESGMTEKQDGFPIELGMTGEVSYQDKEKQWLNENREAIESYNAKIKRNGSFSEGLRKF
jgi:hypothetical protein